jgi:AbrB family looped-hinge helix DNA binding protein
MVATRSVVRVQEDGQVTLPETARARLGIKPGELLTVVETDAGMVITPSRLVAARALDEIGAALREQGWSIDDLDEWIEMGRAERDDLLREMYGIDATPDRS